MPSPPTFSVIMPVFNGGEYLARAVDSALRQRYSDFELILVDDGSTDDAVDTIRRIEDPRIQVLRQTNQGTSAASNAGLRVARGTYVTILDQDDLWARDILGRHLEVFRVQPGVDVTFTWFSFIGELDEDLRLPLRRWRGRISFEQLLLDNVIGCSSTVAMRRRAVADIGGLDEAFPRMYDLDLYLRLLRARPAAALAIPEVLAFYRRRPRQQSSDWRAMQEDWQALLAKLSGSAPEATSRLTRRATANMNRYFAYLAYESNDFRSACRLLGEGFRLNRHGFVLDARNWKLAAACLAGLLLPTEVRLRLETLAGIRARTR